MAIIEEEERFTATIRSEADAWEAFEAALQGRFNEKPLVPEFDGWPNQEIVFWVGEKHEVLTAPMMEGLLAYQRGLYRSFLFLTEDTTNLRRLSEELRHKYEVEFKVSEGSTKVVPNWDAILERIVDASVDKMTGTELVVVILGLALVWGANSVTRAYLKHRSDVAASNANSEVTRRMLEAQDFASEQETERLRVVTEALVNATGTRALVDASDEAKEGVLKAASRVDSTQIGDVEVPPEVARRMTRRSRSDPQEGELVGAFLVLRNDSAPNTRFRVRLRHVESGEEFFAHIRDALLAGEDREIISEAEWRHVPFWGRVEVTRHRGEISEATVVEALRRVA